MDAQARRELYSPAGALTLAVVLAAALLLSATGLATGEAIREEPYAFLVLAALTLILQRFSVPIGVNGYIGVAPVGILACAFMLGPGPAITLAALAPLTRLFLGALPHRVAFDAGQFAVSAGAAAFAYEALAHLSASGTMQLAAAAAAGLTYTTVNNLLVCWVFSLVGGGSLLQAWNEHFRFGRYHYLSFGPLAFASAFAYEGLGVAGLIAFNIPAALVLVSIRQYVAATQERTEVLTQSNDDLKLLFEFSGGLAALAHDRAALVAHAESSIAGLIGGDVAIGATPRTGEIVLEASGEIVGSLKFLQPDQVDAERWERLRDLVLPQLATALESTALVDQVRKTHLETIAALSRSMEAKDYYTGGHTERVAELSVALAARLGYEGDELEAIRIGGLLHDIGKIGIPERILHKPGPLNDAEWQVMRNHPIISDEILADVNVSPLVRQIARSSHERVDGNGYPDGLAGEEIPLPARIALVADAFDAITTARPYRPARRAAEAIAEIHAGAGTQFCARVVSALDRLSREDPELLGVLPPFAAVRVA